MVKWAKPNQKLHFVRYNREFAVTVIVITEFDWLRVKRKYRAAFLYCTKFFFTCNLVFLDYSWKPEKTWYYYLMNKPSTNTSTSMMVFINILCAAFKSSFYAALRRIMYKLKFLKYLNQQKYINGWWKYIDNVWIRAQKAAHRLVGEIDSRCSQPYFDSLYQWFSTMVSRHFCVLRVSSDMSPNNSKH